MKKKVHTQKRTDEISNSRCVTNDIKNDPESEKVNKTPLKRKTDPITV
jgi:hypothetical protein